MQRYCHYHHFLLHQYSETVAKTVSCAGLVTLQQAVLQYAEEASRSRMTPTRQLNLLLMGAECQGITTTWTCLLR